MHLSAVQAVLGALSLTCFFVASLYLWTLLGYADEDRDNPSTIKRRSLSTIVTCCCSTLLILWLAEPSSHGFTLQRLFGLELQDAFRACLVCVGLTALLFLGPLAQHLLMVCAGDASLLSAPGGTWICVRNLLMAPVTEEFVFRACLARLWAAASISHTVIIFCGPFFFALAHAHHFLEHLRKSRRGSTVWPGARPAHGRRQPYFDQHVMKALTIILFQIFYTSLFGAYASFLLLRTGSTIAVILAHTFCNHQGFPDFSFVGATPGHPLYHQRALIGGLYVLGLVSWAMLLGPATRGFDSPFHRG